MWWLFLLVGVLLGLGCGMRGEGRWDVSRDGPSIACQSDVAWNVITVVGVDMCVCVG